MATTMKVGEALASYASKSRIREEHLPESDGRPMAETDLHHDQMVYLLEALKEHFRNDPLAYVTGNIFLYYLDENGERQSISPGVFVVLGIEKRPRRIYKLEDEGKAPDMVIELTSTNTKVEDLGTKRYIYSMMGVREYFLFDPIGEALQPALVGYRLEGSDYVAMVGSRLRSEALGLDLMVEDGLLRLYDHKTGERLRTHEESEAEIVRLRQELAKRNELK